jgi:hypothetical protein
VVLHKVSSEAVSAGHFSPLAGAAAKKKAGSSIRPLSRASFY